MRFGSVFVDRDDRFETERIVSEVGELRAAFEKEPLLVLVESMTLDICGKLCKCIFPQSHRLFKQFNLFGSFDDPFLL